MGVSMSVSGDEPVERFLYDSPEVSVICRADLPASDSNVAPAIARLYERLGDSIADELRGAFAIILYDKKLRVLKAWADHFGAERLVFAEQPGFLAIATDARLLLPLFAERPEIDPVAVQQYLQYSCIPAPKTIFVGISRLQAGHQLTSRPGPQVRAYWDMRYDESHESKSEAAWAADTERALRSAVSRTASGVDPSRLGCFLSGGTDSSSIAGLLSQVTNDRARTFSIGFDDPRYNEINFARIAAKHCNAEHHEYFVTPDDILALIKKAVPAYDEPFGNSSVIPTFYCARLAAENGITHLLAGDGGDELFGGNVRYTDDRLFQRYHSIPLWVRRFCIEPAVSTGLSCTRLHFFDLASRYIRRSKINVPDRLFSYSLLSSVPGTDLFTSDFMASIEGHDPLAPVRNHFHAAPAQNDLNRWLYLDMKITIADNDLRKVSVMSRLAGVTARYPMLEPALAAFTGTIPADLKVRKSQLRYLFKKAMSGVLPPQIIAKSKHGFGLPYSVWLGEDRRLQDFTFDVLGSTRSRHRGYFRTDLLEWLWSQYKTIHQKFFGDLLWTFLMLELWHVNQHDAAMQFETTGVFQPVS